MILEESNLTEQRWYKKNWHKDSQKINFFLLYKVFKWYLQILYCSYDYKMQYRMYHSDIAQLQTY